MAKTDERNETWTIDSPLEEITLEMVNSPPPDDDEVDASTQPLHADAGKNGSSKSRRAKLPKKKSTRRRNS